MTTSRYVRPVDELPQSRPSPIYAAINLALLFAAFALAGRGDLQDAEREASDHESIYSSLWIEECR